MNLILLQADEIDEAGVVILATSDERFVHILEVLDPDDGATLKAGILDGDIGSAEVSWVTNAFVEEPNAYARVDGYPAILLGDGRAQCRRIGARFGHKDAYSSGECVIKGCRLRMVKDTFHPPPFRPHIDVVLAAPRPKVLDRMLTTLSVLGLRKVTICLAEKVEKSYLMTPKLRAAHVEDKLRDGISQACCHTQLPQVEVTFAPFEKMLDGLEDCDVRLYGHPHVDAKVRDIVKTTSRVIMAVGPEGGWTDAEVSALESRGFTGVTLGPRILKTTEALISLVALIYDAV